MLDYEAKDGYTTVALGKHNSVQEALDKLNRFFAHGWYEASFSEDSKAILIEGTYLNQRKEYPLKITGHSKDRIATLL